MTALPLRRSRLEHPPLTRPGQLGRHSRSHPAPGTAPDPQAMAWVRATLADAVGVVAPPERVVMVRTGRKRLAMVECADGTRLALKEYHDDRGLWTRRWLQRLVEAGFGPPARHAVTPPRGWSNSHRTLVTDVAPGSAWATTLQAPAPDRDAAAVAAADWLAGLQSLPVMLPDRTGYRAGDELCRQNRMLGDHFPSHAARISRVAEAAHARLYGFQGAGRPTLVASHGDLHPRNLFVDGTPPRTVTAIDVDTAGLRHPSYDPGYALAQLLVISWMRTGSFHAGARAGSAFWQRWTAQGGDDAEAVPAEIVRALVQSLHFELVTYRNGRSELLDHWLAVAELMLADGVTQALASLGTAPEPAS